MPPLTLEEAFESFERDALRLEGLSSYSVPEEEAAFTAFASGSDPDMSFLQGWLDHLRAVSGSGRSHRRVRILSPVPTDYERFEVEAAYPLNREAGEQIRIVKGARSDLPDAWIFDGKYAFEMNYSDSGEFLGAAPLSDASDYIAAVEALWSAAPDHG